MINYPGEGREHELKRTQKANNEESGICKRI
jgi:hypothetical protein